MIEYDEVGNRESELIGLEYHQKIKNKLYLEERGLTALLKVRVVTELGHLESQFKVP
jgi:hypothetical protein